MKEPSGGSKSCRRWIFIPAALLCAAIGGLACQFPGHAACKEQEPAAGQPPAGEWQPLFDGKSLQGWRETPFAGRGKVHVDDGTIVLDQGAMTGITWEGAFPKSNYEVLVEAARLDGHDFFAGITFPVKESHCSWINGGWGGRLVGLSSLDGFDASENETMTLRDFDKGRWYLLLLQVSDDRIQAWIDGEPVIDVSTIDRQIGLRPGPIKLSVPFGVASYSTTAALRKVQYRLLAPPAPDPKD
jgi:hypothetical protein